MSKASLQEEFVHLITAQQKLIHSICSLYYSLPEDRKDLFQEIVLALWKAYPAFKYQSKISTWIYRISINVAISFYRKNLVRQGNNIPLNEQVSQIQNVEKYEKEQQLNLLDQFINELKELDKALMLLYLEDKSHAEIADILGISATPELKAMFKFPSVRLTGKVS